MSGLCCSDAIAACAGYALGSTENFEPFIALARLTARVRSEAIASRDMTRITTARMTSEPGGRLTLNSTFDRCRIGMTAALAVSIFLMAPSAARSQDESEAVSFSLSAEQEGAPQSVSVSFATKVSATELASFAVELDEVDVTRLITNASAKGFDVRPAKPLGPGRHELRLYRLTPDRQGFELVAVWPFEIARDEGWSLVSADIAAEHAVSYNVRGDHNWAAANSAGRLSGRAENGNWRADADLQYLAASERRQRLDDTAVDIGSYAASLSHSGELVSSAVELGHQTIDADPLLISSLNRRGLSASVQTNNKAYGATLFGVRSLESQTADNFTGLGDADEQLFGGTVFVTPLAAKVQRWGTLPPVKQTVWRVRLKSTPLKTALI